MVSGGNVLIFTFIILWLYAYLIDIMYNISSLSHKFLAYL